MRLRRRKALRHGDRGQVRQRENKQFRVWGSQGLLNHEKGIMAARRITCIRIGVGVSLMRTLTRSGIGLRVGGTTMVMADGKCSKLAGRTACSGAS